MAPTTKKTGTGAAKTAKTDKREHRQRKNRQKAREARRDDAGKHLGEVTDRKRQPIRTIRRIPGHGIQGRCGGGHKDARRPRTAGSADDKESPAAPPQNAGGEISAGDLVRLADVGVKIERLSRGESTENQSVSGKVEHKEPSRFRSKRRQI